MKSPIFAALIILLISCSKEETINFVGTYEGKISCTGELSSDNGDDLSLFIVSSSPNNYTLDFGDEVKFQGVGGGNVLTIPDQTINEGGTFDVIKLNGKIQYNSGNKFTLTFDSDVDGESSSCVIDLAKK